MQRKSKIIIISILILVGWVLLYPSFFVSSSDSSFKSVFIDNQQLTNVVFVVIIGVLVYFLYEINKQTLHRTSELLFEKTKLNNELESIITTIPDILFRISNSGIVTYIHANEKVDFLNAPHEILYKRIDEVLPENLSNLIYEHIFLTRSNRAVQVFEYYHKLNGQDKWYESRMVSFSIDEVMIMVRDVTDRKLAVKELNSSEEKFRTLSESSPNGIFQTDLEGKCLYTNKKWQEIYGMSFEESLGEGWSKTIHPEDRDNVFSEWVRTAKEGIEFDMKFRISGENGEIKHVISKARKIENQGYVGTIHDITALVNVEHSLKENKEFLNGVIESTPACIKLVNSEGVVLAMNSIGLMMVEAEDIKEVVDHSVFGLIEEGFKENYKTFHQKVISGEKGKFVFQIKGLKGRKLWLESSAVPLTQSDGSIAQLAITNDITDRILNEQLLIESERSKKEILESITDAFFALDWKWNLTYINPKAGVMFKRKPNELLGKSLWEEFPEIEAERFAEKYEKDLKQKRQIEFEYYYSETNIWLRIKIYPSSTGLSIFCSDITTDKIQRTIYEVERKALLESSNRSKRFNETIDLAVNQVEHVIPGVRYAVILYSEENKCFDCFSSPSLGAEFSDNLVHIPNTSIELPFVEAALQKSSITFTNSKLDKYWNAMQPFLSKHEIHSGHVSPMISSKGNVLGVFCIFVNTENRFKGVDLAPLLKLSDVITSLIDSRRKEDEINLLSLIAKNTAKAVFICDLKQQITWVNAAFTSMTGYTIQDSIGKNPIELLQGKESDLKIVEYLKKQIKDFNPFTLNTVFHKKNDSVYWSRITGQPMFDEVGEISQYFAIQEDITIRKLAKINLQDSEKRYRALFHSNPQPMYIYDKNTKQLTEINESAIKTYGYLQHEFKALKIHELFVDFDSEEVESFIREVDSEKKLFSHKTKEGVIIQVEIVQNFVNISGKEMVLVIINDVTAKLLAEKKLLHSNERFQLVSKAVNDAVWDFDLRKNILHWGEGITNLFGYESPHELPTAESWSGYVHPEDYKLVRKDYGVTIADPEALYWTAEYRFLKKDGSFANILDRAYIIRNKAGEAVRVIGAMHDITEQKNYEEQKLRLIGETQDFERKRFSMELHDGLAQHLVVLNLYLSQLEGADDSEEEIIENCISLVKTSLNQTRSLCYNLTPPELESGLMIALKSMFDRLKALSDFDFNYIVDKTVTDEDFSTADIYNLYRMIQEFVNNSIKHSKAKNINCMIYKPNGYISIEVWDDGVGFDEKNLKAGLGLKNMEQRAKLANVGFDFTSEKDQGTKLFIHLNKLDILS
jgi:PAS domain S-box-containing protein